MRAEGAGRKPVGRRGGRVGLLPMARTMSQAEAERLLRRQVFEDALRAGVLRPCCVKANERRPARIFSTEDVRAVEEMILAGEYPGGSRQEGGAR